MRNPTDYERYIRTAELLSLQKPEGDLACHDELQFQVVHQAAELWMKLVAHEVDGLARLLDKDDLSGASATLRRIEKIQALLVAQLGLLDTMAPRDYMTIRTVLGNGSGQESPGFKHLLKTPGETMWPALERLLARANVTLRQIYEDHPSHDALFRLCEGFVEFDQALQLWRQRHLMLVYRIIGAGTPSLKGKPSELLERGMRQRFFPALWDVRDQLFEEWTKTMLARGAQTGYHG
jgi:tryptophan 2,3-dioxygenase